MYARRFWCAYGLVIAATVGCDRSAPPQPEPTGVVSPKEASTQQPKSAQPEPPRDASSDTAMGNTGVLDEEAFKALHQLKGDKAPTPRGEMIELGATKAYLSLPASSKAPLPAVVVIHEWWGLNEHIKHWADRLAADGYAALAVDLYGGQVATESEQAMTLMKKVDEAAARKTLASAHEFLAKDPRVSASKRGVIGWCFGGGWSLQHAISTPDLDAAVLYYGRLVSDPDALGSISAPVLGVFGNQDGGIPPASVDAFEAAMKKADKPLVVLRYDAGHAFANPSSDRYKDEPAAKAWKEVRAFLRANLQDS